MSDVNTIDQPNFNEMSKEKLLEYAGHLRVAVSKTATKAEILEQINNKLKGRTVAKIADGTTAVRPGHAKIRILKDPLPGASNIPVYLNANGYECTIPRGMDVIVPMRVVRTLNDAKVKRTTQTARQDQWGREYTINTEVDAPSYPFQVLESTPGPEPLTALEQAKLKTSKPRKRYRDLFGYYPRHGQLQAAIEKGLIKLHEDEAIPESELKPVVKETAV